MEEWTSKTLYVVLRTSAEEKSVFTMEQRQSRRWKYIKVEVPVNVAFKVSEVQRYVRSDQPLENDFYFLLSYIARGTGLPVGVGRFCRVLHILLF